MHHRHHCRRPGQLAHEVRGNEVVGIDRATGSVIGAFDCGLVGDHVDDHGAGRLVARGAIGSVAFARQPVGAGLKCPERIGAPLCMAARVVGADGGGHRVEPRIKRSALDHPQEAADLTHPVAAVPDLDPAVVAFLLASPLRVPIMANHNAIYPRDELVSVQRRPASHDLRQLGINGAQPVGIGDQFGTRHDGRQHQVVDVAGTKDLADPRQPGGHRNRIRDPKGRQALADPQLGGHLRGDLLDDVDSPVVAAGAFFAQPQPVQVVDRHQHLGRRPVLGTRRGADPIHQRPRRRIRFEHVFDTTPAYRRVDLSSPRTSVTVVHQYIAQRAFQHVLVVSASNKVIITDLEGEVLAEHTRPAPGIKYVGNRRPRGPRPKTGKPSPKS